MSLLLFRCTTHIESSRKVNWVIDIHPSFFVFHFSVYLLHQGMLRARGKYLLMVDADGATQISDLDRLESALSDAEAKDSRVIVVGSRAHLQDDAVATVRCLYMDDIVMLCSYIYFFLITIVVSPLSLLYVCCV